MLPPTREEFLTRIRNCLLDAVDSGVLASSPSDIFRLLKHEFQEEGDGTRIVTVFGGASLDKGQATDEFFVKADGTRISFGITALYPRAVPPTLRAYRFHLRYADGSNPRYVRIDLNRGSGGDALVEPRSHVHIGAERLRVPVPIMTPVEILEKYLYGLPLPPP